MTRSTRSLHAPTPFLILGALSALCLAAPARAQSTANAVAQDSAADSVAQSAPATHKKSRFGRFGRAIGKTASKVGISRETAARIAINAATGGAADALTHAASAGTANALTRSAAAGAANALTHTAAGTAPLPTLSAQSGGAEEALQASQFLAAVALRASQGDPDANRAMQALSAAMSTPDSQFAALQRRINAGDVSAARDLQIHEAEIVRKALAQHNP
jgi:hypothetical protein